MEEVHACPECQSNYTYQDGALWVCPECGHEWVPGSASENSEEGTLDVNGVPLFDGDSVIIIKDLKVKGSKKAIKQGTKVKSIRLIEDTGDGHDIDCKIDGFGAMKLKSEFVKKG